MADTAGAREGATVPAATEVALTRGPEGTVGVMLARSGARWEIQRLAPGGAAEASGRLHVGQALVAVDGRDIAPLTLDEALALVKGAPGSVVVLCAAAAADIDLATVHDVEELQRMGTPRLKAALRARGMRCGGTASLLAERLWWRCKLSHFADSSRRRLAQQQSQRPVGAYSAVQPLNLAAEKQRFLAAAAEYEAGRSTRRPDDPQFEYADSESCERACPAVACTCARYKLWQDYGPADDRYVRYAISIIQLSLLQQDAAAGGGRRGGGDGSDARTAGTAWMGEQRGCARGGEQKRPWRRRRDAHGG